MGENGAAEEFYTPGALLDPVSIRVQVPKYGCGNCIGCLPVRKVAGAVQKQALVRLSRQAVGVSSATLAFTGLWQGYPSSTHHREKQPGGPLCGVLNLGGPESALAAPNPHRPCRRFAGRDFTRSPQPLRNIPLPH